MLTSRCKGDTAQASERQQRQEELDILRQQALRAEQFEIENGELRRKLRLRETGERNSDDGSNRTNSTELTSNHHPSGVSPDANVAAAFDPPSVPYEEHEKLKRDYGKLAVSHTTLQEKYRKAKDISKAWRKYDDKQKLRQAEKQARMKLVDDSRHAPSPDGEQGRNESVQPPSFSHDSIPTPRSLSVTPRPSAPGREATAGPGHFKRHEASHAKPVTNVKIGDGNHLLKDPAADGVSTEAGQGDTTETSDESTDPHVDVQPSRKRPQEKDTEGRISEVLPGDDNSDCPIVVSERSLKRKRPIPAATKEEVMIHDDRATPPGSIAKPIDVKNEQDSSSPAVQVALDCLKEVEDTLDLDEVGARALTPRKRRRLQLLIRSQGHNLPGLPLTQLNRERLANGSEGDVRAHCVGERDTMGGDEEDGNDLPVLRNRAYYVKLGEEHGIKLWGEEQRKVKSRQDAHANLDAAVSERLRGSQNSKLARQWLHNRRVHARHAKAAEVQQALLDIPQQATPIPQARRDHGLESAVEGEFEFGPAGRASSEPIEALKSQKQLSSALRAARVAGPTVLQPTNPNAQVLPRTSEYPVSKYSHQRSRDDRGAAQVPFLAEDGEENDDADGVTQLPYEERVASGLTHIKTPKAADLHHRLGTLLAGPSPEKPPLISTRAGQFATSLTSPEVQKTQSFSHNLSSSRTSGKGSLTMHNERERTSRPMVQNNRALNSVAQSRDGGFEYPTLTTSISKRPSEQLLTLAEGPSIVLPEEEPLRARPLRRLRLDDFKVNPASNQGYDYAFDEVIRNRDQRKCLPNCTKPECCGTKFQKVVELGGFVTPRKPALWSSSPADEAEEEVTLLEDYLGYDRGRINRLSDDEKHQLIIQVKAKQFANEHGRHRQAFERNTSPPGFWRTDMPTTQELEEDREAARQMTRRKLEERHREAMRPGGRWMFRDE